jgi:nitroimidazol reductase NimA-like FMN-containing flavoprotein (pyridoxamine 5'-phosphate oxidase superfamily)
MRRRDREIQDRAEIDQIIDAAMVCRLGMCQGGVPYVVPISFGYDGRCIYFHGAAEGTKVDLLIANPRVCVEFEGEVRLRADERSACGWSISYRSVIGYGLAAEITDPDAKRHALNQIMKHYAGRDDWTFDPGQLARTRTWCITIETVTGKHS